jgi:hypothetical protein
MRKMRKMVYLWCLLCAPVFAQNGGDGIEARLLYAEGADFVLTTKGQRTVYKVGELRSLYSLALNKADTIQTGSGGTVEISLLPGNTLVKLAENTTFVFNGSEDRGGGISLKLLYGRLRIKSGEYETREISLQAGNGMVSFRDGDMGFDFIVQPSVSGATFSQPFLRVYGFSGNALLSVLNTTANIPRVPIGAYETVSLELFTPLSLVERRPLAQDSVSFWNRNNFKDAPPLVMETIEKEREEAPPPPPPVIVQAPPPAPLAPEIRYIDPDYTPYYRALRVKNTATILGSLLVASGIVLEGFASSYLNRGDHGKAQTFSSMGYGPLGVGVAALLGAILYKPDFVPPPQ